MDNAQMCITGEGEYLRQALELAFRGRKATHWALVDGCLVFFWAPPPAKAMITNRDYHNRQDGLLPYDIVGQKKFTQGWRACFETQNLVDVSGTPLVYHHTAEQATVVALNWLSQAEYGKEPAHDGDNSKGWQVFNGAWGHVFEMWQGICAIRPKWAMHGK
jgi:hypothetical protein